MKGRPDVFSLHNVRKPAVFERRGAPQDILRNFIGRCRKAGCIDDHSVWWSQTGSNRRPHACKARALPTELWPHLSFEARRVSGVYPTARSAASAKRARAVARGTMTKMVGLGRLELPTSRLSSARSNQLSYKPEPVAGLPAEANRTALLARPGRKRNEDGGVPHDWPDWPLILKSFDKVRTR